MRIIYCVLLLLCLVLLFSACGNSKTDAKEKTDTEPVAERVKESDKAQIEETAMDNRENIVYTLSSPVEDVLKDPCFGNFGRFLFPVDRTVSETMTLKEISSSRVYVWYNYIDPAKTVEIIQTLHDHAAAGEQIFYDIYTEEEKAADPSKEDTGLFFFKGNPGEKFAVANAGARMAAVLGNGDTLPYFDRADIPQASAVVMQYTGYSGVSQKDAPTYACVGTSDGIANWKTVQSRLESLKALGIPTEFHSYEGLPHGFGIGTGTNAEGWIEDAAAFWEAQCI